MPVRPLSRARRLLPLVLALAGAPPARLAAQADSVVARDAGARMVRVARDTYAILHDDATDDWPHGNTGVVVTRDGVLVVDATYLPSRARDDIALIRSVTRLPVRYLVYTHWHFDHNNGGMAYEEAFPGLRVVAERADADYVEINGLYWSRMSVATNSTRRQALEQLRQRLQAGTDSAGRALTPHVRDSLARVIAQRTAEFEELATLRVVRPNETFVGRRTIVLGGERIELVDRGAGNSPHDVTIHLPARRVLFTGDLLVQSPVPYPFGSWPRPWIKVLDALAAVPVASLVPGHGPVMHDHAYTRQVRALLEAAVTQTEPLIRSGRTLAQIQATVDLRDVRAQVPVWRDPAQDENWRQVVSALIERVWRDLRGAG